MDAPGGRGFPIGGRGAAVGGGCGTLILVIVLAFLGVDPSQILQLLDPSGGGSGEAGSVRDPESPARAPAGAPAPGDEAAQFVSVVLADTEDTWGPILARERVRYEPPTLVLFTDRVRSACGLASAASGPFYCPGDSKVYIDLGFYRELRERFGAPGDFAQAYVIAHEVGHHVQNLLGISSKVSQLQDRLDERRANELSVKLELQADCLAGVWARTAEEERQILEPGDIEEGLRAAAAIGDDRIQRQTAGYVEPESWTHGSSAQRVEWLRRGLESGAIASCDTFGVVGGVVGGSGRGN